MTTVQDALEYLRMGFSVIPLRSREKVPAIPAWKEFQTRRPTEAEVRSWFSDETLNIGIICGSVSNGLVVVDFDDAEAVPFVVEDIGELAKKTMVVRTGKGFHVYMRRPDTQSMKLSNLHIDLQAEGKYVVAPPSVHPSGATYTVMGAKAVADAPADLIESLVRLNEMFPIAKAVAERWETGNRHEIALRLASFLKARARWPREQTERLIKGVMSLKNDRDEVTDRLRAVRDAYEKDYPYDGLPADLIEEIVKALPKGAGEIWTLYDRGMPGDQFWTAFICRNDGVFRVIHRKDGDDETRIFSKPLILVDAWHSEGDDENQIRFTFFLGDMRYQGTKGEVANMIIESGLTGIVPNNIKMAVAACVEYYISNGMVKVRESYEAIGVYRNRERFEIALIDKDISAMRGTEPWFVFRSYRKYPGDPKLDFEKFNRLWEFFDPDILAMLYGFSAIAPFSYALKGEGNFFWPLLVLKGPRGTGKTTLGELFTSYLYGIGEGGPSDVTSDFRLLDFITGTTFPRLIDESENAKFEGSKFSIKISTTLKDASQKQFVGVRGNIDRTKKLYAARTPLILAGNKIDLEDPALMARTIFIDFDATDMKSSKVRRLFAEEILNSLGRGFGIALSEFIASKFDFKGLISAIRNRQIEFQFSDPRREDFYASIYVGLQAWDEFLRTLGISFSLADYLSEERFLKLVRRFEESNEEESQDRQSILALIDWVKSRIGLMQDLENEGDVNAAQYLEMRQMFRKIEENNKEWALITQTALSEFRRFAPWFNESTLSDVAEALSKYFGLRREVFYDRSRTARIGGFPARVLKIPLGDVDIDSYGVGGHSPDDGGGWYTEKSKKERAPPDGGIHGYELVYANGIQQNLGKNEIQMKMYTSDQREHTLLNRGGEDDLREKIKNDGNMVYTLKQNMENTEKKCIPEDVTMRNQRLHPHNYRVLKEFFMNGLKYSPGFSFSTVEDLSDRVYAGFLEAVGAALEQGTQRDADLPAQDPKIPDGLSDLERDVVSFIIERQNKSPGCVTPKMVSDALSLRYSDLLDLNRSRGVLEGLYERHILRHFKWGYRMVEEA